MNDGCLHERQLDVITNNTDFSRPFLFNLINIFYQLSVHGAKVFWRFRADLAVLVVPQFSLDTFFSSIASKRDILFRGHDILEDSSPVKGDEYRCHIFDTIVIYNMLLPRCELLGRIAINY